jgi:hypothetical protein
VVKPTKKDIRNAVEKLIKDRNYWIKTRANALTLSKEQDIDKILDKELLKYVQS